MPRANRHFVPGHVWHITHRCHQQAFLLKFARALTSSIGCAPSSGSGHCIGRSPHSTTRPCCASGARLTALIWAGKPGR